MRWSQIFNLLATSTAVLAIHHSQSLQCSRREDSYQYVGAHEPSKLVYIPEYLKSRVFVMTDILNEPDDQQSVVRYLLYSNEFDTRALCATTGTWLRNTTHTDAIRHIVEAYGQVSENLNRHVHPLNQYLSGEQMQRLITSGPAVYGKAALDEPISEGALMLIERLRESSRPLWILIWGGSNTLAQALDYMQRNLTEAEFATLRSRIRVYAISDQDDTGEWIRNTWPDIFYIASIHAFSNYQMATWRGMWEGLQHLSLNKVMMGEPWVYQYIKMGPLGNAYPHRLIGIEGDTPSFLYLIPNGLGDPEQPTYGSWGGRWGPTNIGVAHWSDTVDVFYMKDGTNETSNKASCARWRDHFQNDMATRMQWTVSPDFSNGTHPPVVRVNGTTGPAPIRLKVTPGSEITLDASTTYDPDHPEDSTRLQFEWYQYHESDYLVRAAPRPDEWRLQLEGLGSDAYTPNTTDANDEGFRQFVRGDMVRVLVPDEEEDWEYHLILQVTSNKNPELPLRRYLRVLILASRDGTDPNTCCDAMVTP